MHGRQSSFGLLKRCFRRLSSQRTDLRCLAHVRDTTEQPAALLRSVPSGFVDASGAHRIKQRNHKRTAEEEQEVLEDVEASILLGFSPDSLAADPQAAAETLAEEGVLRLNGMLSADASAALRVHIDGILDQGMQNVANGSKAYSDLFGEFMCREHRYDLLLPLDVHILETVRHVIERVAPLLNHSIGEDCTMCELEALISDPGSHAQPLHFDTAFDYNEPRVSMLIALQDVTASMGPTAFYPSTNTPEWHLAYKRRDEELEELLECYPRVVGEMSAGDCYLYDTRVLHYGGANTSHLRLATANSEASADSRNLSTPAPDNVGVRRTMLGLSFQVQTGQFRNDNANMRSEYKSKYRILDVGNWTIAC